MTCPTELELDQAISTGADHEMREHVASCPACRAIWDETERLIVLAGQLQVAQPGGAMLEERRTAMLAAWVPPEPAIKVPTPRWRIGAVGASIAVAVALVIVIGTREHASPPAIAAHPSRGTVHPHDGAVFRLAFSPPDEIVRLRDGVIDIDVDPLASGERFRVVVGTDEVEVRGTSFEVRAHADHLIAVHVGHGRVEVRVAGSPVIVLGNGDAWQLPVPAPITPPANLPMPPMPPIMPPMPPMHHATIARQPDPIAPPVTTTAQEVAFDQGWDALRRGDYGPAAAAFGRAIALAPDGALSEDATFWHAVSLARLQRTTDAIAALRAFLDAFPTSTRADEASAMLGWLLVDTHEYFEARRRFEVAKNGLSPAVRESAVKGLAALPTAR